MANHIANLTASATILASLLVTNGAAQEMKKKRFELNSTCLTMPFNAEEIDFMHKVYDTQKKLALIRRQEFAGLSEEQLGSVEDEYKMRRDAAEKCRLLLAQARSDLRQQKKKENEQSLKVSYIGVASAYRNIEKDKCAWEKAFQTHFNGTKQIRAALKGGEYGPEAVRMLVDIMRKFKAVPGFSRHTTGVAVDFQTIEDGIRLGPYSNQIRQWNKSWFHGWLVKNAKTYKFKPLSTEPWHWEYKE